MPTQPPEMTPAEAKQVIIEYLRDGETPITDVVSVSHAPPHTRATC